MVVEFQQGSLRLILIRIIVRTSDDFQSTGGPGGAEVAGMTIPEHGHIRIPVQTAPMGGVQIDGIESLPQPHRRSRLSASAARS